MSTHTYGTISYMSPELLSLGKFAKAADVYSFAILSAGPPPARTPSSCPRPPGLPRCRTSLRCCAAACLATPEPLSPESVAFGRHQRNISAASAPFDDNPADCIPQPVCREPPPRRPIERAQTVGTTWCMCDTAA